MNRDITLEPIDGCRILGLFSLLIQNQYLDLIRLGLTEKYFREAGPREVRESTTCRDTSPRGLHHLQHQEQDLAINVVYTLLLYCLYL